MKNFSEAEQTKVEGGYSSCFGIFAGVVAVLTVGLLLDLLGMAIGLSLFSPAKKILYSLSVGAIIWVFVSTVASTYIGGWTAGYFSLPKAKGQGMLNGFMVSALSIFVFLLLTFSTLGIIVSGSLSGLQYALTATKESTKAMVTTLKDVSDLSPKLSEKAKKAIPTLKPVIDQIKQKAAELLPADQALAEKIKAELETLMTRYLNAIESARYEDAKKALVDFLSERTGKSSEEINQQIDEWQEAYTEAKAEAYQRVAEVSQNTAKAVSQFSLLNFFILISGIVAGMMGGVHGMRNRDKSLI
jgi:hypothetical protein